MLPLLVLGVFPTGTRLPYTWSSRRSAAPSSSGRKTVDGKRSRANPIRESPETAEMKCSFPPHTSYCISWSSDSASEGSLPISRQRMQRQRFPVALSRSWASWRKLECLDPATISFAGISRWIRWSRVYSGMRDFAYAMRSTISCSR